MSSRAKALLPWVLSLAIVAFLLATTDLAAVGDALARAHWPRLLAFLAAFTLLTFAADALTLLPLFRRFVAPVTPRETLTIKGVSYFLNALNYSLAAGAMAWLLARRHHVPVARPLSALVWYFFVDLIALAALLALGSTLGHALLAATPLAARLPWVLAAILLIIAGALAYWRLGWNFIVLGRLRNLRIFHAFREATARDYVTFVPLRAAFILLYVFMHAALLPAFDVTIPFAALLTYAPLLTFVAIIPASVSGLGAAQGVMILLFSPHITAAHPAAIIIAYSTVTGPLMTLMRLLIGYVFLHRLARSDRPTAAAVADATEDATEQESASATSP